MSNKAAIDNAFREGFEYGIASDLDVDEARQEFVDSCIDL